MSTPETNPRALTALRTRRDSTLAALGATAWRTIAAAVVAAMIAANALAGSAAARPIAPACPDTVIPNVPIVPNAVGCWNAVAVQATHLAAPYNVQGLIYTGYVQAAVYDAVTKIDGRYVPYHEFPSPADVAVAGASPDAATAAAAYTMLTSSFLAFPATDDAYLIVPGLPGHGPGRTPHDILRLHQLARWSGGTWRRRRDQNRSGRRQRPNSTLLVGG